MHSQLSSRGRPGRRLEGIPGANKGMDLKSKTLSGAEVQQIMDAFNRGSTGLRNRAAVALMYRGGLRVLETVSLLPEDLDLASRLVHVKRGSKGGRQRTAGIDDGAILHLERWMARRKQLGIPSSATLICKLDGEPLAPSAVRTLLKGAAAKAGLERRVNPHAFRHSHAAKMAMARVPVHLVQRQLGHMNLATTTAYLADIAPADLVDALSTVDFDS